MSNKLRRRELITEDTQVTATISDAKIVHGQFGRQVELKVNVDAGEFKGTSFKDWASFAVDKEDGEEYIPYGGSLYQVLALAEPNIDEVLDDDNLTEKKYQQFLKKAVKDLEGMEIIARVGVKAPKSKPDKKRNCLQPGSFGPADAADLDDFDDLN